MKRVKLFHHCDQCQPWGKPHKPLSLGNPPRGRKKRKERKIYIKKIISMDKRNFFISIQNFVFNGSVLTFNKIYVMCFSVFVNEFGLHGVIY